MLKYPTTSSTNVGRPSTRYGFFQQHHTTKVEPCWPPKVVSCRRSLVASRPLGGGNVLLQTIQDLLARIVYGRFTVRWCRQRRQIASRLHYNSVYGRVGRWGTSTGHVIGSNYYYDVMDFVFVAKRLNRALSNKHEINDVTRRTVAR